VKTNSRYPELIAIKVTREQAEDIRRAAEADDRPVSHFLRRVLAEVIQKREPDEPKETIAS
jgi:uncharacterized protein (DUF1778 family)